MVLTVAIDLLILAAVPVIAAVGRRLVTLRYSGRAVFVLAMAPVIWALRDVPIISLLVPLAVLGVLVALRRVDIY